MSLVLVTTAEDLHGQYAAHAAADGAPGGPATSVPRGHAPRATSPAPASRAERGVGATGSSGPDGPGAPPPLAGAVHEPDARAGDQTSGGPQDAGREPAAGSAGRASRAERGVGATGFSGPGRREVCDVRGGWGASVGAGPRAVVMTMGALHDGHATLIRTARAHVGPRGLVTVTVFVNPLQFGAGEDLDRYPRTLDADLKTAEAAGADLVFAPSVDQVYPGGEPQVRISAGPMGERLEGASRPGHFDGMLTVVAKLLHLTRPDVAFFGQKDAQQLALIRRMARDLNFPAEIVGVPTVRESDGLALSSRNRYLSPAERPTALALSRALFAARDRLGAQQALHARAEATPNTHARAAALSAIGEARAAADAHAVAQAGPGGADAVRAAARAVLDEAARSVPPLALDYLALVDPATFSEVPDDHDGDAILAVAAKVGATRLIDNIPLTFGVPK